MSTSGLNPTGSLCFGAINTTEVSIGFDDAITIDNTKTPAEIYFHGVKVPNINGTQTDFTSLIASNEGFNPSEVLNIGTSNTSEITIGPLKIDNTVVPPQIYINEIAYFPIDKDLHYYSLFADTSGDANSLPSSLIIINDDGNNTITITDNNIINLVEGGIYEFTIETIIYPS